MEDEDGSVSGPLGLWRWPILNQIKAKQQAEIELAQAKAQAIRQPKQGQDDDFDIIDNRMRKTRHIY